MVLTTSLSNVDIEKYQSTVRGAVNKLLLSRRYFVLYTEREDLFQIGWIALINCLDTFDTNRGVKFETYASKAILNAVNKELKRLVLEHKYMSSIEAPEYDIPEFQDEYMKKLVDTVENSCVFSTKDKRVFWLRFIDGQSFKQIGKEIGASREHARQVYNRFIKVLKELMSHVR